MKLSISHFLKGQYTKLPLPMKWDLTGRTVVVVGANVGLGFEASRHFATMNPSKLILACRNVAKGEAALADIQKTTGCKTMEVWPIDLADFGSIKAFVDRFEKEGGGRLDILLENAGINTRKYTETKDGWESTLQVNNLGTDLLALLLLPTLMRSPADDTFPRLTVVTSEAHHFVPKLVEGDAEHVLKKLSDKEHCTKKVMGNRYPVSKLLNVWFVRALVSRLPNETPLTVDMVNPGLCWSELAREWNANPVYAVLIYLFLSILARSTEVGSRTLVDAALGGTRQEYQGRYLNICKVEEESDYAIGEEGQKLQERIWDETIDILSRVDPRVKEIVEQYLKPT